MNRYLPLFICFLTSLSLHAAEEVTVSDDDESTHSRALVPASTHISNNENPFAYLPDETVLNIIEHTIVWDGNSYVNQMLRESKDHHALIRNMLCFGRSCKRFNELVVGYLSPLHKSKGPALKFHISQYSKVFQTKLPPPPGMAEFIRRFNLPETIEEENEEEQPAQNKLINFFEFMNSRKCTSKFSLDLELQPHQLNEYNSHFCESLFPEGLRVNYTFSKNGIPIEPPVSDAIQTTLQTTGARGGSIQRLRFNETFGIFHDEGWRRFLGLSALRELKSLFLYELRAAVTENFFPVLSRCQNLRNLEEISLTGTNFPLSDLEALANAQVAFKLKKFGVRHDCLTWDTQSMERAVELLSTSPVFEELEELALNHNGALLSNAQLRYLLGARPSLKSVGWGSIERRVSKEEMEEIKRLWPDFSVIF